MKNVLSALSALIVLVSGWTCLAQQKPILDQTWTPLEGKYLSFSAGPAGVAAAIDLDNHLFIHDPQSPHFEPLEGAPDARHVTVLPDGGLLVVGVDGQVLRGTRAEGEIQFAQLGETPMVEAVSGDESTLYAIDAKGTTYHFEAKSGKWVRIPGRLEHLAGNPVGLVGLDESGTPYQRNSASTKWRKLKGSLKAVSLMGETLWGIDQRDNLVIRDQRTGAWVFVERGVSAFDVSEDGQIVAMLKQVAQFTDVERLRTRVSLGITMAKEGLKGSVAEFENAKKELEETSRKLNGIKRDVSQLTSEIRKAQGAKKKQLQDKQKVSQAKQKQFERRAGKLKERLDELTAKRVQYQGFKKTLTDQGLALGMEFD